MLTTVGSSCQSGSVYCGNGTCLVGTKRCDGIQDCLNGSDEVGCGKQCIYRYISTLRSVIIIGGVGT